MLKIPVFLFLLLLPMVINAQLFNDFFVDGTCRVDLQFAGNYNETGVSVFKLKKEPVWGGRRSNLTPGFVEGDFRFQVSDSASHRLIYTDGFNTLFREWQTTPEARNIYKSFENTVIFPFPAATVRFTVEKRSGYKDWIPVFSGYINPADQLIDRSSPPQVPVKVFGKLLPPDIAVDVAIIAEGYTAREMKKFYNDAKNLVDNICSHEPFRKLAGRFNFYAIAAVSAESGVSKPTTGEWKNTAVGAHFHTFYSPRYLTSPRHFLLRDLAASVPYDAIYILANTDEYGGGGIYNFYALTAARGRDARAVTVHEFGHSFAGLADEYFYEQGDVLDQTYKLEDEPWEPNITTLRQFDKKWQNILPANIPVPTPIDEEIKQSTTLPGVYEGGGYKTKGIYRPTPDCRMKTNSADDFCPVCTKAIENRIDFLTGKE